MSPRIKTKLYQASSLLRLAGLAVPMTAHAQDAAASSAPAANAASNGFEEIIVTANKREERNSKVGATITALSQVTLQQQHITTLADLAQAVPGLTFTETENATPVYTLRGVGFYETSLAAYPDVSVYLDQAPLPFPTETQLTLFDIQRIEVLKGPQGTLFGNNATGGAINYIANKPTADFEAGGDVTFGRFNTGQVDGFVSGPVSGTLLGRLAFSATEGDGWQHSQTRNDTNGKPDEFAGRMLLDWAATDDLHFELNLNGWHNGSQPQQSQFVKFQPNFPTPSAAIRQPVAPDDATVADWSKQFEPYGNEGLIQAALRTDYDLTDTITITSITNYVHYTRDNRPDDDGTQFTVNDITQNTGYIEDFSQELRVAGGAGSPFRWVGGLNFSSDRVWERDTVSWPQGTTATFFAGSKGNSDDSLQNMENYAAFAHVEYDIFDQLTLKAGVRGTEADRGTNACGAYFRGTGLDPNGIIQSYIGGISDELTGQPARPVAQNQCAMISEQPASRFQLHHLHEKLDENNVSWLGGLDWKPADNLLAYVNITRGYKAGGFPTLPASFDPADAPVRQEKLTDYEVGVKTQFFDRHLLVDAAAFYYTYDDKQLKSRIIDPLFGVLTALVNVPQSSIRGAELEVHERPLAGLDIGAAATYLDASVDTFVGVNQIGQVANFAGSAVPYTPKWQLSGNVNYDHPITDEWAGFVGAQVTYRSTTNSSIGSPALYTIPSYAVVDLQAGVESQDGQWRAFLWGKNVFNKFYLTNVVQLEDDVVRYTGMPATYGATVSYKFSSGNEEVTPSAPYTPPPVQAPAMPHSYLVFFDFNKSDLTPQAVSIVNQAAANAGPAKVTQLTVTGHTDTVGSDAYNMRLSRRRAESVAAQLEKDGIPSSEIEIVAKGKRDLLVPTADGVKEPQNRRVQIVYSGGPTS
jgi:iron complex outermembrane recepter protein